MHIVVCLQIYPLWRAFSKIYVYSDLLRRLRLGGKPKRAQKMCIYDCKRLRVDGVLFVYRELQFKMK